MTKIAEAQFPCILHDSKDVVLTHKNIFALSCGCVYVLVDYGDGIRLLSNAASREHVGTSLSWIDPAIKTVSGNVDGK